MRAQHLYVAALSAALLFACDDGGDSEATPEQDASTTDAMLGDTGGGGSGGEGGAGGEGGGPIHTGPEIQIEPTVLSVLSDIMRTSEPVELSISNVGSEPLTVSKIELQELPGTEFFGLTDVPGLPATVPPGESLVIGVTYTAADRSEQTTRLSVHSNDRDEGMLLIPINGKLRETCLRAMPGSVELGAIDRGAESGRFGLKIINCGDVALNVDAVRIEGDAGFQWAAENGEDPVGTLLQRGDTVDLEVWYVNADLEIGDVVAGTLTFVTDAARMGELNIPLRARGGGGPSCNVVITPERLEFGSVRINRSKTLEMEVRNEGTAECQLREAAVTKTNGPETNVFTLTRGLEVELLEAGSVHTVELTFEPTEAFPQGDRAELNIDFHDPHLGENRRAGAFVAAVGDEARIGGDPQSVVFPQVTAETCASSVFTARAVNVAFVELDVDGFSLEGDDCADFVMLSEPEIDGPVRLDPDDRLSWTFVHQPNQTAQDRCILTVSSDAHNFQMLEIPLVGEGVESDATVDEFEVGRLNVRNDAHFHLKRPAVEDSIVVFRNDERYDSWEFDEGRNDVVFVPMNHPDRDDELRVEYDAVCFDRR